MAYKKVPRFYTDEQAEAFLEQDLSEYMEDIKTWPRVDMVEFLSNYQQPKDKTITMRWPSGLLEEVKAKAAAEGVGYQKYIRAAVQASL